jgi:hypothetical protein
MVEHGFGWRRAPKLALCAVLSAVVAAGCAMMGGVSKDSSPEDKRAAVTERVNARWAALLKGDLDTAYTFLSPATRETVSPGSYKGLARGKGYRKIAIESVECQVEVCNVRLMLTYDHRIMKGIVTPVEERWVIDRGQFWFVWQP